MHNSQLMSYFRNKLYICCHYHKHFDILSGDASFSDFLDKCMDGIGIFELSSDYPQIM